MRKHVVLTIYLLLIFLHGQVSRAEVERFEINVDQEARINPVYFSSELKIDLTGNEGMGGAAVKVWQHSDRVDADPSVLVARNMYDGATPVVSLQLINANSRALLAEDVLGLTLTDFEIFVDSKSGVKYLIGAGLTGDGVKLVRSVMGAARYDWLTLDVGRDRLNVDDWEGTIQFLATADYDLDGEPELFLYATGRDISPRKLFCVKPEPFEVIWEREVSSAIQPSSFVVCPDSLEPQVLFTCYGTQNGVSDDTFEDRYGYLAAIGPLGEVKFARPILTNGVTSALASLDSDQQRFVFYHNQPIDSDPPSDTSEAIAQHAVSITDCNGRIVKTIEVDELIRSLWVGRYRSSAQPRIFLLGLSGTVSVYDQELNLLAQSYRSLLSTYVGQVRFDQSEPPLTLFGGAGNLYLFNDRFELQGAWPMTSSEIEPLAVADGKLSSLLITGPGNAGVVKVHYRSGWAIFVANVQQHQELVLTILIILTVGLVLTNFLRLRAANRLQAREQLLTAIFNNMQDGFYRTDLDGYIVWASPSCSRLLGTDDNFSPVGRHASDFYVNPEKRQELIEELERSGRVTDWPVELRRTDGKIIFVATNSNIYRDKNGKAAGVEGVFRDISNRLRMEQALRLSEEQYRSVVESAGEAIFSVDRKGIYLFMNTIAAARLGSTAEAMVGKSLFDAFPPEIAERQFNSVKRVFDSGIGMVVESKTILKGKEHNYNTSLQPIRDDRGEIVSVLGIARDLTELVTAQNRLMLQEEFVGSLLDSANSLILCLDGEHNISIFNSECERISGLRRDDILFQPWRETFGTLLGEELSKFESWLDDPTASICETSLASRSGGFLTVLWSKTSVRAPGGSGESRLVIGQDISQRKEAETALSLSVSRYRLLVENVGAIISLIDANGSLHFINSVGAEQIGTTVEQAVGISMREIFPPQLAEEHLQMIAEVLRTGEEFNGEVLTSIDGEWHWFQAHIQAYPERFDNVPVAIVIAHDITQRKRTEDSLRASEEKYRGIFDESVATVYIFDERRRFIDSNQAGLDLLGYSREELLQMSLADVDATAGTVDAVYNDLLTGGRLYNVEQRLSRKDGREITVLNNSRPLTDLGGRVIGVQSTLIDITDRKQAEQTLRHRLEIEQLAASISTEFLTMGHDQIDSGINAALERVGKFIRAERGFLLRLSPDHSRLSVTHHWHAPNVRPVKERLESPSAESLRWWIEKLKDEKFLVVRSTDKLPDSVESQRGFYEEAETRSRLAVPLRIQGEIIGSLNFSSVSEERDWPIEDIRMLNVIGEVFINALEQKRKSEEVARVNQERLDQERQIAGGFAHELRNALFPARNMLDKLLHSSTTSLSIEDRESFSQLIEASLNRASDIVGSILSYTRLGSQKKEEKVNLAEVVREVLDANRLALESEMVRVTIEGDEGLLIRSNRKQLFMVINNIVINALDAMEFVTIRMLSLTWGVEEGQGVLRIADNGSGMTLETSRKIFEPFFSTKPDKGTGLGLATVQKLVTLYGGTLEVKSAPDKGSLFIIKHELAGR